MKNFLIILAFLTLGIFFSNRVVAQAKANVRQVNQRARIAEGRKSGELTGKEAAALNAQQRNIRRTKRRTKADGVVTKEEKRRINRKQRRASRNIRRQKNDVQRNN